MTNFKLKPNHAPVKAYYEMLEKFGRGNFDNEGNLRRAFESLLEKCARPFEWFIVSEYQITRAGKSPLRVDAVVLDAFNLPRGYWEAKDDKDDLKAEINKKFTAGYPRTNILFQKPTWATLVQDGRITFDGDISAPEKLVEVLRLFFEWRQPHQEDWDRAVREFSERIPEIAKGAMALIEAERKTNRTFVERFAAFAEICRESINPDLKDEAVEEMLVQHLLTERIFRRIFDNPEFTRRNVIAAEIEKVIDSLTKRHFSRDSFLKDLDPFYKAIEEAASTTGSYTEKQAFLNRVYERFFQGFSKKDADTHGIVYTPQPIVDFMVRSVEEVLKTEFGRSLSDRDVHILDPFVGTGNFITRVMQEIKTSRLPQKYKEELHCNEVMLLPYYIASMNIEHAYLDRVDEYEPFEGICLVDTFELAEPRQAGFEFMNEGNTERIRKKKKAPIFVVVGNPPYNAWQERENDGNKNRNHPELNKRITETYAKASSASNNNALGDPYVKAFRFASDRIQAGGVIAFVSNSSFVHKISFDGMRKHLLHDFDKIYIVDLGGDVKATPKISGTTHNVFGIKLGVTITILIKKTEHDVTKRPELLYTAVGKDWKRGKKYDQLNSWGNLSPILWEHLKPDEKNTWLTKDFAEGFDEFMPTGILKKNRRNKNTDKAIFHTFSNGNDSGRDDWVYNFEKTALLKSAKKFADVYNSEIDRYFRDGSPENLDLFLISDEREIKWTRNAKRDLRAGKYASFDPLHARPALYHAFSKQWLYPGKIYNKEVAHFPRIFPTFTSQEENIALCVPGAGNRKEFGALATNLIPTLDVAFEKIQCFPFYTYNEDGSNRRENITDWALSEFRTHYADNSISKWDIFHYTYALLHHPEYRTRYAANLKRELPRIPMAPEFRAYATIGAALMKLHIEYEQQPEYPLTRTETGQLDWRVEKMTLPKDKTQLRYNGFLTFCGIPPEVYEYRLGNRSALEWVVDQYRVSTDTRSGIVNDPNREGDPEYIVRLVGQVVTVSMETVRLVQQLASLSIDQA